MSSPGLWRRSIILVICAVPVVLLLAGLGVWQVQRLAWKQALIARIEERVNAAPVAAPGPAAWQAIDQKSAEYRRVTISGRYLNDRETLVQAVTGYGAGYWVLTPLQTEEGFTVLVNRGFVPSDRRDPSTRLAGQIAGETTLTGLLRLTEAKGGFLRTNAPAANRWYSRDVHAIAMARQLAGVAPYFIDADATPNAGGYPRGGLTVIAFSNNHLVYALTWFGLALMVIIWVGYMVRHEWLSSAQPPPGGKLQA